MDKLELKGFKGLREIGELMVNPDWPMKSKALLKDINLEQLVPGKYQPRLTFEDTSLEELSKSIAVKGIIQPLVARLLPNNTYEIIAGERRYRAAKLAGLSKVPVVVRELDDESSLAFAIIENLQRENLHPLEEALAIEKMSSQFKLTHQEIADTLGRSRTFVTNALRLLGLCEQVKGFLAGGKIEVGHARALLTLPQERQFVLAQRIIELKLTVRDAEKLVKQSKKTGLKKKSPYAEQVEYWVNELSRSLASKVFININEKGEGKLIVHFTSPNEVDWLVEHLEVKRNS